MNETNSEVEIRDEHGRLTGRFGFLDGRLHGLATLFDSGRLLAEISYDHGLRHGDMRCYGVEGQLSGVVPHVADLQHGEARYFYPDGALARCANYKDGRLHGEVRDYAQDGSLLSTTNYEEGKKQGSSSAMPAATAVPDEAAAQRKSWLARLVEG